MSGSAAVGIAAQGRFVPVEFRGVHALREKYEKVGEGGVRPAIGVERQGLEGSEGDGVRELSPLPREGP